MSSLTDTATVADVLADLDRDGYSIVPGVLDRNEAETIRAELMAIAEAIPHGRNSFEGFHTRRIYALFRKTRLMDRLATHPLLLGVLPLDDFTERNGATRLVPASHTWTDRQPDDSAAVKIAEMAAGSVMFYVGTLWHGGGANNSDRPRLGVILEYAAAWLRPQENHILGVPREVVATLPERLQELLGYNVYPPFLGYVDGRHPRRLLDR